MVNDVQYQFNLLRLQNAYTLRPSIKMGIFIYLFDMFLFHLFIFYNNLDQVECKKDEKPISLNPKKRY